MAFKHRQSYYIRISANQVLQLNLYLDERHVEWMSSLILERVLLALKTRIVPKLREETKKRKAKVDVYRGAGYQMAFYFQTTSQKHSILLKSKQVHLHEDSASVQQFPAQIPHLVTDLTQDDQNAGEFDLDLPFEQDVQVKQEDLEMPAHAESTTEDQQGEEVDLKPDHKPKLEVRYSGFSIFGRTLIIVIEPYPALTNPRRAATPVPPQRELSTAPHGSPNRNRASNSMQPPDLPHKRPLFREASETPDVDEDDDMSRFRARSQSILQSHEVANSESSAEVSLPTDERGSMLQRMASGDRRAGDANVNLDMRQYMQ